MTVSEACTTLAGIMESRNWLGTASGDFMHCQAEITGPRITLHYTRDRSDVYRSVFAVESPVVTEPSTYEHFYSLAARMDLDKALSGIGKVSDDTNSDFVVAADNDDLMFEYLTDPIRRNEDAHEKLRLSEILHAHFAAKRN